jgi:geranylgeranyl reductase family protein
MPTFDVIVVGGGPAGSTAARRLALGGARVLLLERDRMPRYKPCGGAIPIRPEPLLDFDLDAVVERIVTRTVLSYRARPLRTVRAEPTRIQMVMRPRFDQLLLEMAARAGADVHEGEPVRAVTSGPDGVEIVSAAARYRAAMVIAADGWPSVAARELPRGPAGGWALEAELEPAASAPPVPGDLAYLDFGGVPAGYAWIFPKDGQLSVGVCSRDPQVAPRFKNLLQEYIDRSPPLRGARCKVLEGHALPFHRPGRTLASERIAAAGDAAGLIDPLSGEGIAFAVRSGRIAADIMLAALEGAAALTDYPAAIASAFATDFADSRRFAELFDRHPFPAVWSICRLPSVRRRFLRILGGSLSYGEALRSLRRNPLARIAFAASRWLAGDRAPLPSPS